MKTINFELSKILNDLGLLDNIETEYIYTKRDIGFGNIDYDIIEGRYFNIEDGDIKTLTLEETIKFISNNVNNKGRIYCNLELQKELWDTFSVLEIFDIKKAEVMLEYLLDNNLLLKLK